MAPSIRYSQVAGEVLWYSFPNIPQLDCQLLWIDDWRTWIFPGPSCPLFPLSAQTSRPTAIPQMKLDEKKLTSSFLPPSRPEPPLLAFDPTQCFEFFRARVRKTSSRESAFEPKIPLKKILTGFPCYGPSGWIAFLCQVPVGRSCQCPREGDCLPIPLPLFFDPSD